MPKGWKKNAKYIHHLELTHDEYIQKKEKIREQKKKQYEALKKQKYPKNNTPFNKNSQSKKQKTSKKKTSKKKTSKLKNKCKNFNSNFEFEFSKPKYIIYNKKKTPKKYSTCSICYEEKLENNLISINCNRKSIHSFTSNNDKIVCGACCKKITLCPYCRSHKLISTKYTSNRKKKKTIAAKIAWSRKLKNKDILKKVSIHAWMKYMKKKKYPNSIIWTTSYLALPLKLYKFYRHQNITFTSFENLNTTVFDEYLEIPYPDDELYYY